MSEIEVGLAQLKHLTTKEQKCCIETLLKIYRNIVSNPSESKYRTLKISNKRFDAEVWSHDGAKTIMLSSGFILEDEKISLPLGVDISNALNALVESRNVKPSENEWVEETKTVGLSEERLREEELRKKALKEKEKQMAELKKDLAERKAIAERIVAEHRSSVQQRITRPSIATPRGEGAVSKMSDHVKRSGG